MKTIFKQKFLLIFAVFFMEIITVAATEKLDFDDMPIDISESDFIKKRRSAQILNISSHAK